MKKFIVGCMCLLVNANPTTLYATITGNYTTPQGFYVFGEVDDNVVYEMGSSIPPVSHEVLYGDSIHLSSYSDILSAGAGIVMWESAWGFARAFAESWVTLELEPLVIGLEVTLNYWVTSCEPYGDSSGQISLKDITTGDTLIYDDAPYGDGSLIYELNNIDPSHEFQLSLEASTDLWHHIGDQVRANGSSLWVTIEPTLIPEPATLLLLGLGVLMVRKSRRPKPQF
jgi:hypothetical protein